jgi:transcriptional regulator with XRE-family HTH domain
MATLEGLAQAIGTNVRIGRTGRGWTLDELVDRSGVSRRTLVQIEQGKTNPSIGILLRLSDALGIGLPQLVAVTNTDAIQVTTAGTAPVLWRGDHGGVGYLVAGTGPPDVLELWDWTMQPGEVHDSEPHSRGTREQVLVLSGELLLTIDKKEQLLGPGDAAGFRGDCRHRYQAAPGSNSPARFTLSVFQPGVGTGDPAVSRAL